MPEEVLRLGVDPRPGEQGFRRFDAAAERTKRGVTSLDAAIIGMTAGIAVLAGAGSVVAGATRRLVEIGSAAEETANKFDVVMGEAAGRVREELAELHDIIPATRAELEGLTSGIQDMLVPMGVARDRAADMSVEFVRIAGDLASFNDVAPVAVLQAMQSAIAGQSEPMRRWGVDTRVTRLETLALTEGLIEEGEALDETARAQAVMLAIQRDSTDAIGDAARTADENSNALKRLARDRRQMIEDLGVLTSEALETSGALTELAESVEDLGGLIEQHEDSIRTGLTGAFDLAATAAEGFKVSLQGVIDLIDLLPGASNTLAKLTEDMRELREQRVALEEARRIQRDVFEGGAMPSGLTGDFEHDVARLVELSEQRAEAQAQIAADSKMEAQIKANLAKIDEAIANAAEEAAQSTALWARASAEGATSLEMAVEGLDDVQSAIEQTRFDLLFADGDEEAGKLLDTLDDLLDRQTKLRDMTQEMVDEFLRLNNEGFMEFREAIEQVELLRKTLTLSIPSQIAVGRRDGPPGSGKPSDTTDELTKMLRTVDQVGRSVAAFTDNMDSLDPALRQAIRGVSDLIGAVSSIQAGGAVGIIGGITAGIGGLVSLFSDQQRQAEIEAARANFERVLDDYVNTLADMDRWERLVQDAEQGAERAARALLDAWVAELPDKIQDEASQAISKMFASGMGIEEILEALAGSFGPDAQAILDAYREKLQQIEDLRQEEIDSMTQDFEIRRLVALGLDKEAAAKRRELQLQEDLANALGDSELEALIREVYELEEAARAAAKAAEEEAEAKRKAAAAHQLYLDSLSIRARELALGGDDVGAAEVRARARAEEEKARAEALLESGDIGLDFFERWIAVIDGEYAQAVQDAIDAAEREAQAKREAAEAAREAAEAEAERTRRSFEDLELRRMAVEGMDDELRLRRLEIEQRRELQEALADDVGPDYLNELKEIQELEFADLLRRLAEDDRRSALRQSAASVSQGMRASSFATSVTEASAQQMTSILYSQLSYQSYLPRIYQALTSGASGGSARPIRVAGRPGSIDEFDQGMGFEQDRTNRAAGLPVTL